MRSEEAKKYKNPYIREGEIRFEGSDIFNDIEIVNLENVTVRDFVASCKDDAKYENAWGTLVIKGVKYWFGTNPDEDKQIDDIPQDILDMLIEDIGGCYYWHYCRRYKLKLKGE